MLCKYCKSNTIVADSVDNKDTDETYKLRVCTKCGHGFFTVEFPVEIDHRFTEDWLKYRKKHKNIPTRSNMYYTKYGIQKIIDEDAGGMKIKRNRSKKYE